MIMYSKKWEILKKKQAENIERLYKEHPDDWFYKSQMERPLEQRTGFAPQNGRCWRCGNNIAEGEKGITLDELGDYIILGCPHCYQAFDD